MHPPTKPHLKLIAFGLVILLTTTATEPADADDPGLPPVPGGGTVTIYRDEYAVPHVFASSEVAAAFGAGYSQAEDERADLVKRALGVQGKLAAALGPGPGEAFVESDFKTLTFDIPDIAEAAWSEIKGTSRKVLDAYADGINLYFMSHAGPPGYTPDLITGETLLAMALADNSLEASYRTPALHGEEDAGASNVWAVGRSRTVDGAAFLLADGHQPFEEDARAIHLNFPSRGTTFDVVGNAEDYAGLGGGGNQFVAHGGTSNRPLGGVVIQNKIRLTLRGLEYQTPQGWKPVESEIARIEVKGAPHPRLRLIRRTEYGPAQVDLKRGLITSLRIFVLEDPRFADVKLEMARLFDLSDVRAAHSQPFSSRGNSVTLGAPQTGKDAGFGFVNEAYVPQLDPSLDWYQPVDGTGNDVWRLGLDRPLYRIDDDPQAPQLPNRIETDGVTIEGDLVKSANDRPCDTTVPANQVNFAGGCDFPSEVVHRETGTTWRGERLADLLGGAEGTIDETAAKGIAADLYVEKAAVFVDLLERASELYGDTMSLSPAGRRLLEILQEWDFYATTDASGMTIVQLMSYDSDFGRWLDETIGHSPPTDPLPDPTPEEARLFAGALNRTAIVLLTTHGKLDVPWGEANVYSRGGKSIGVPGGTGKWPALWMAWGSAKEVLKTGRFDVSAGSRHPLLMSYTADGEMKVLHTVPTGQLSPEIWPGSCQITRTMDLYASQQFKEIRTDLEEIKANLDPCGEEEGRPPVTTLE